MSYTPTEWETGQTITAEKLNKLEQGVAGAGGGSDLPEVTANDKDKYLHTNASTGDLEWSAVSGGGGLVVTITGGDMNKTYNEIKQALQSGPVVCVAEIDGALSYNNIIYSADGDNDRTPNILYTYDPMNGTPVMYTVFNGDGYPQVNNS